MSEWISVNDRLPITPVDGQSFESVEVLITDGKYVHVSEFKAGGITKVWSEFSIYGPIARSQITHWMPLPSPPEDSQ